MHKASAELNILVNFGAFTKQFDIQQLRVWKIIFTTWFYNFPNI